MSTKGLGIYRKRVYDYIESCGLKLNEQQSKNLRSLLREYANARTKGLQDRIMEKEIKLSHIVGCTKCDVCVKHNPRIQ